MREKAPLISHNILSVMFVLLGAYLVLPSFNSIRLMQSSRDWPVIEGNVFSSELEARWPDAQPSQANEYLARVWFIYQVQDKQYFSSTLRFVQDYSRDMQSVQQTLEKYPVGKKVAVKYQPDDPSIAVVEKAGVPVIDCVKLGMGFLFMITGSIALLGMVFREKRR
jgi:hypothetical protein